MNETLLSSIRERYLHALDQIAEAAAGSGRLPEAVRLVVVSKSQPLEVIRAAVAAGISIFGENYAEEALGKIVALKETEVEWHMIGHVQTNPWVPGEIVFCWETGGKAPQRTWTVMADGTVLGQRVSDLRKQFAQINGTVVEPADDPVFDETMLRLVKQFQLARGLPPTGIVGPQTLMRLSGAADATAPKLVREQKGK